MEVPASGATGGEVDKHTNGFENGSGYVDVTPFQGESGYMDVAPSQDGVDV